MRNVFLSWLLMLLVVPFSKAQMEETVQPKSFSLAANLLQHPQHIVLSPLKPEEISALDNTATKNGKLPLFSRNIPVQINLNNSGTWTTLSHGDRIWQVKISSAGALALVPLFEKFYLPQGAAFHAYMPGKEEILGAFTHANTPEPRAFCTGLLHGDECILEYYEPAEVKGQGIIEMKEVGYAYRFITPLRDTRSASAAGACEVNSICAEANSFTDQRRSVARILVVSNQGQGFCSGALVNNVRQDCTPYFLSAQHCSEGTSANQYAQWVFYFNYEASTCNGTTGPTNKTVTGCSKIADSNDNGGDTGSDFLLLQLGSQPNSTYNVFYSGWNNVNTPSTSGVCFHHPDGDIKKISTYTTALVSTTWNTVPDTHWDVQWAATTNGHGVTEPGSSGSPLFNANGEIIGTLTGGDSYCNTPNQKDQYGKVSYDWITNGTANNRRLKPWLDPDNTGATSLAGTNTPCGSTVQNDAGIQSVVSPAGDLCGINTFTPQVVLRNFGGNTITDVTINYTIDGNVYQYVYHGSLTAGTTTTITLPSVTLPVGAHTFIAETTSPNGQTDNNTVNDVQTFNFNILSINDQLTLQLHTDDYGSETTWDVKDASNNIVQEGGPYGDVNNGEQLNSAFCLAPGCYTFTIHDSYGDGMSDPFDGSFTLSRGGTTYATLTQGNFGYTEAHNFCILSTGIDEQNGLQVSVMPNPSAGVFNVNFLNTDVKTIRVFDAIGRVVAETEMSTGMYRLDLSGQSKGVYVLQVESKTGSAVQKLILK